MLIFCIENYDESNQDFELCEYDATYVHHKTISRVGGVLMFHFVQGVFVCLCCISKSIFFNPRISPTGVVSLISMPVSSF